MVLDVRRLLQGLGIVPRSVVQRLAADVDVIVGAVALPGAVGSVRGCRESVGCVFDAVGGEVDVALDELVVVGLGDDGAVDGGFGVHVDDGVGFRSDVWRLVLIWY